jgi:clan AA aspartic protease
MHDVGLFRTTIEIENWHNPGVKRPVADILVDTGAELTCVPRAILEELGIKPDRRQRFEVADGRRIERDVGFGIVHAGGTYAPDLIVFAEPGDMILLGAHSLEGLNLKIDPVRKELVSAGSIIMAAEPVAC